MQRPQDPAVPQPPPLPRLPRGATWHARWVLPLLVLLALVLIPWSDKPPPVFDQAQMQLAAERWHKAMARRAAASAAPNTATSPVSPIGTVPVRLVPAVPSPATASAAR